MKNSKTEKKYFMKIKQYTLYTKQYTYIKSKKKRLYSRFFVNMVCLIGMVVLKKLA